MNFLKADNYVDYLSKKYEIEFSLLEDNSVQLIKSDPIYGLKIIIGESNDKIFGKTEISRNLDNLESDIITFKDSIRPYERHQIDTHELFLDKRFHLRVFADKEIPDSIITKHLKATVERKNSDIDKHLPQELRGLERDTLPIRIYRIYQSLEKEQLGTLRGKEIKTCANTVYN